MTARLFELVRHADVSGVSGTGVVAEGIEYEDGGIALRWKGEWPATAVWPNMESLLAIHGHDGKTTVRYVGTEEPPSYTARIIRALEVGQPAVGVGFDHSAYSGEAAIQIHASRVAGWLSWLEILGGSPDAAVRTKRSDAKYRWQWSWRSPGNEVEVFYLTGEPNEFPLEAG